MSLNIKNPEAYTLASELAKLTGQSMTAVVIDALREMLKEIQRKHEQEMQVQEMMAIGKRCAAHLNSQTAVDHGELLYDEMGLPK